MATSCETYESANTKYDSGDYEGALADIEASLALEVTLPGLFTKGKVLEKLDRCLEAVPIYEDVIEMIPQEMEARLLPAVEGALADCAKVLAREVREVDDSEIDDPVVDPDPEPEQAETEDRPRWYRDVAAPILIGAGVAGVTVGGVYLGRAASTSPQSAPDYGGFIAQRDELRRSQIVGGIALGIGCGLILGGAARYLFLALRESKSESVAFTPTVGFSDHAYGAGLQVRGRF